MKKTPKKFYQEHEVKAALQIVRRLQAEDGPLKRAYYSFADLVDKELAKELTEGRLKKRAAESLRPLLIRSLEEWAAKKRDAK